MNRLEKRSLGAVLTALLLISLAAHPTSAGTTGQLCGRVVDSEGVVLPGVSVSASSPSQIGGVQLAQTDLSGWFQYPRLSPGYYTVRTQLDGFLTQELTEVQVRLDHMTELRVTLPLATFGDEVDVVVSTPVVDPEQVSTGQTFTAEYLQEAALGMENRNYLGMLGQTAGVNQKYIRIQVMGSTSFDNNFLIDGMDTTDAYNGIPSFGSLSLEAVEEVAFHTAGFEAEYGRATGGVVNLITKSGGNRFRGSVDYRYSDSDLQTSGEHLDPDEATAKFSDWNASFGGPVIRDRLWFFTAMQNINGEITPTGASTTEQWSEQNYLGKLTWQASANWSLVGKMMANPLEYDDAASSQFRSLEATWLEAWDVVNGQVDLSGVLSDGLLIGLRLGAQETQYDLLPQDGDLTTIGHFNLVTQEYYGNASDQLYDERGRREIDTDLSWFVDDFGGAHDLKAGIKYTDSGYLSNWCYNGGGQPCTAGVEGFHFLDIVNAEGNNIPLQMLVQEAVGQQQFDGSIWSTYLQDTWRIRPDFTLKMGLRWDSSRQTNDLGQKIADLSMLQPRIGGAWDIRRRGRDILRASWGRYMHPSSLHIAEYVGQSSTPLETWWSCSDFGLTDPAFCAEVAAAEGLGYRTDRADWDAGGWVLFPDLVFASEPNQTSPDLDPMYADELVLAYERELYRRTSLELSYVKKDTNKVIEDTCNGNLPTPTEGADCSYYVVGNIPGLRKDYEGLILRLESRAHDRMHIIGSYVFSESKGAVPGRDTSRAFDFYPYHFVNQYGYLWDHSRHRVKLNGYVVLPLDFSLALNSWWNSEFRWEPVTRLPGVPGVILLEPRGNRSEPGEYQLDLQVGRGFTWGRTRLKLFATVYNVLDTEISTAVCDTDTGCGDLDLGDPIEWQRPRRYELGVRVEF